MAPIVSIILPVYNGERYLHSAIESVLAQSIPDWELLIINDGSTDCSPSVCDDYSRKDPRIKIYHQPNGGVNSARAKGIDNASGTYLTFLDADDTFYPTALEIMTGLFDNDTDLVSNGTFNHILDRYSFILELWSGTIPPGICGKMFRSSIFKKIEYHLERRLAMGEDLLLNSIYALEIDKIKVTHKNVYIINRDNYDSVTKTFKHNWEYEKYFFSRVEDLFLRCCREWSYYEKIELLVNKSWLNAMKYTMLNGNSINYRDFEFKSVRNYFKSRAEYLGPSEKLIFIIKNPFLYRLILKSYLAIRKKRHL